MTALTPTGLAVEHLRTPLGLGERRPRLSWRFAPTAERAAAPSAYRLQIVASGTPLWDTGRRPHPDLPSVTYDGPPLHSSTRYDWRLTIWDTRGGAAAAASWFETGLLRPGDWTAAWIGRDPQRIDPVQPPQDEDDRTWRTRWLDPCPYLRREFTARAPVTRARVHVSARGLYEVWLNGSRVGDDELAPGWTDYRYRVPYRTHDVTALLHDGGNALGAILADGWYSGYVGFDPRRQARHYGDAPQFIAQLHLDYADGSREVVATDAAWRERSGPLAYADLLMGERYDARAELTGWSEPGYDDGSWAPAAVVDRDTARLTAAPDHPVRAVEDLAPVSVSRRGDGRHVVDFGQNIAGRLRLTVRDAAPGTRIRLRHAEMLDGGELYVANLRTAEATDVYLTAGAPAETYEPRFTCHGFRYAEISGCPGALAPADITARVLQTDLPYDGGFSCSDPAVQQLQSNIRWGQRGNFVSVPTDCPQRDERLGWLADAQVFLPTAARNADVSAFFARWLRDVVSGQDADGAFPDVAPVACVTGPGAPAWGDAGVIIPWELYRRYGDIRVLERCFDAMAAWVSYVRRHNPGLVWRARTAKSYGDWLQTGADTPRDVLATAYFARSTELTARAARVLGRRKDAAAYEDLHWAIREAFTAAFVDEDGRVAGGTQTGYLLALAFGLLPEHLIPRAVGHLADDVEARGRALTTGFVGVPLLCPVLTAHGRADLAYGLLHREEFPGWLYSARHGATTIWERWDGWTEDGGFQSADMNSFNHYALGSVGDWLYGRVAGIGQHPESSGYRRLLLRPTPGGRLTWARARQQTPYGEVRCGWLQARDVLHVEVAVPPGTTATLHVPTADPGWVRESGGAVEEAEGVRVTGKEQGVVIVELASGSYHFTVGE